MDASCLRLSCWLPRRCSRSACPVERSQPDQHQGEAAGTHGAAEGTEGGTSSEGGQVTETKHEELFGIDTESIPVVIAFVAVSAALAVAVLAVRPVAVLLLVMVFGFLATAFDIREAIHQADESRMTVLILAAVTAALHIVLGLLAARIALSRHDVVAQTG